LSGLGEHPHDERQKPAAMDTSGLGKPVALDRGGLETLSDDELEAELTIAAYAPGRVRWERYQRLLVERLRRRPIVA
jgi:hypothetical protein